jgi:hypothetical protein
MLTPGCWGRPPRPTPCALRSGGVQGDVKGGGIALGGLADVQDQLRPALIVYPVSSIPQVPLTIAGIRLLSVHLVCQGIIEEELRGKLIRRAR